MKLRFLGKFFLAVFLVSGFVGLVGAVDWGIGDNWRIGENWHNLGWVTPTPTLPPPPSHVGNVIVTKTINLVYDNNSWVELAAGTESSLYRVSNVWYVNGSVYPVVSSPVPSATPVSGTTDTDIFVIVILIFLVVLDVVVMLAFGGVPLVGYFIGLFTFLIGTVATATVGFNVNEVQGFFCVFVVLMGGFTMLLTSVQNRRRKK